MKTPSLKLRFAIVMSISALLLVVGMGALSMRFAEKDLLATLSAQQLGTAARAANDLDEDLRFAVDVLQAAAVAMPAEVMTSEEGFEGFNRQHPALLQVFNGLFVIDPRGIVTTAYPNTVAGLVGLDVAARFYFKRAMASAKPVISEPLRGRASLAPIIDVVIPVLDRQGNVAALMVGALDLDRRNVLGSLSATRIGRTGYFTVMTAGPKPIVLVHPDPTRVMKEMVGAALSTIVGAHHADVALTTFDGGEALVGYQQLRMTDWVLAAVLPRAEAFATIDRARERTIVTGLAAALIALPMAWLIAWYLLKPLDRLRREVASTADAGGVVHDATVGRLDEVGRMALAYNAMLRDQRASEASRIASDQDRRRLVAILESSGDLVAMADVQGNLTYLNASGRTHCGIALDEDLAKTRLQDHFPAWAFAKLRHEGMRDALRRGIWMGETAILGVDGQEVPVDQTVIAHRNVEGRLEFFSSLMHDTSAAKQASAAMRSSEARMLSIADALPVMVAFVDREHRYRFVNSRYEDHFGTDKSRLLGRSVPDVIGDKAFEIYRPFFERAAQGDPQVFELESHAGLRPVHFLVKLIPQFDDLDHITGFHFIHQDVTDHKVENQRLSQLARADALTGLLNRAGFESVIVEAMARSQHHLSAMALFYLDVDRFKSINDRFGHQIGDKLLRGFAQRLVRAVRSADIAARLGGDEFVVIAEGLRNVDDVRSIAGKILRAMRPDFELNGATLAITASIGVAVYTGEAVKVEELIGRADAALYRAKAAGRDRYELDDRMETFGTTSLIAGDLHGFTATTV